MDSIHYSCYDLDSTLCDDYVTQVVYTPDSTYRIPLAVIDSVGFVTPETKYQPDVKVIEGDIRSYVLSSDSLTVFFKTDSPTNLLPHIGDKLVTTEVSPTFPIGFAGQVETVEDRGDSIAVVCSSVGLDEVFEYFFFVSRGTPEGTEAKQRKAWNELGHWEGEYSPGPFNFPLTNFVTSNIKPDIRGDLAFSAESHHNVRITPTWTGKAVIAVTPLLGVVYLLDITEEDVVNEDFSLSGHIEWLHDFTPGIIPIVELGIPFLWLYGEVGAFLRAEATVSMEQHWQQTFRYSFHCEASSNHWLIPRLSFNNVRLSNNHSGQVLVEGAFSGGIYGELGIVFFDKRIASTAFRAEAGIKVGGDAMLYRKDMESSLHSTQVYNTLKGSEVYFSGFYNVGIQANLVTFGLDHNFESLSDEHVFARAGIVPKFSDTILQREKGNGSILYASAKASGISLPVDLGFTLFEKEKLDGTTGYSAYDYTGPSAELYSSFFEQSPSVGYEVYPTVKLFGVEMLADPKAEVEKCPVPVTITDFRITKSEHKENGFTNDGKYYDYRFHAATTVEIEDVENVYDWGYVYEDPQGKKAHISLKAHGTSYTDTNYAYYRNEPHSTARLYGYVQYVGDSEYYYGDPHDYPLDYEGGEMCPDANHPHAIDLGLPSGTKWACCNVGASTPEGYGGYYAWGETEEKNDYRPGTYKYAIVDNWGYWDDVEKKYYLCTNIGSEISGTSYDVAHVKWGGSYRMPTLAECQELLNNCSSQWTQQNGVSGRLFTGPNGNSVFLPAAGDRWDTGVHYQGDWGYYWSGTLYPGSYGAYVLSFYSGYSYWVDLCNRYYGRSVRPVSK